MIGRYIYWIKILPWRMKHAYKRKKWARSGNVRIHATVKMYPETSVNADLGEIEIGAHSCVRGQLEIQRKHGKIVVGEYCYIGDHSRIWAAEEIRIGNHVLIAHNVNVFDNDTHPIDCKERREDYIGIVMKGERNDFSTLGHNPIEIGDDAWIGCNAIILKGIRIGKGSIVAAGSVVTKDIPDYCVAVGNPAHVVKQLERHTDE